MFKHGQHSNNEKENLIGSALVTPCLAIDFSWKKASLLYTYYHVIPILL